MPRQSKTTTPGAARATTNGQAGDPAGGSLYVEHLEQDFWDRASLRQIYDAALMLHCSPWAVLAHCVARALSLIDPRVTLPDVICGPGSLNWFAAIAAASAGSKGGATTVARQLVPVATPVRNLGSGEGLVDQYMSIATKGNPAHQIHRSLIFSVNEIDDVAALANRSGATLMSVVRSGFSGEQLGHSYARNRATPPLDPHTYRMLVLLSVQPGRAGWLLDDVAGGTLQRIMWFPAIDRRVRAGAGRWQICPLPLPDPADLDAWQRYPRELQIPPEAEAVIQIESVKRHNGEANALDGHALFSREKLAFGLAVLDGRLEMSLQDWRLSGVAAKVSAYIRDQVTVLLEDERTRAVVREGQLRGIAREAADAERYAATEDRIITVGARALDKLRAAPGRRMTNDALVHDSFNSRDRPACRAALAQMEHGGAIAHEMDNSTNPATKWWVLL